MPDGNVKTVTLSPCFLLRRRRHFPAAHRTVQLLLKLARDGHEKRFF
ncbi:hypothetical protein R3I93_019951 [Phoxinus phoxinus]|uniref:Uncharacterized protein n=1 Tax=Phoxinus phoxinus TaxID=58324 RepID=A0AAN9GUK1_9TELE